jgi:hypothetical protein
MKRIDYLKLALKHKKYSDHDWVIRCFAILKPDTDSIKDSYYLKPICQPFGFGYINSESIFEQFEDSPKPGEPLFKFSERVTADETWAPNIKQPVETSVGNLFLNAVTVLEAFGTKFPYQTGTISVSTFENIIVDKLRDTPKNETDRSDAYYYVDEYIKFTDAMLYVRDFSHLVSLSATRKNIRKPTGIDAFKKQVMIKYDGKLNDPIELAKFEGELKAFDDAYMADDPTDGKFVKGKIKNIARKKLFLTLGQGLSFDEGGNKKPITNSLVDGWSTDPDDMTSMVNDARMASFFRGAETVKGGVSAKTLLRAANNFSIKEGDCGSKLGLTRIYDKSNYKQLIGKTVLTGGSKVVNTGEEAGVYLGKAIAVRSPMFCKLKGDTICSVCAGAKLSTLPTGLSIPLTEISAIIMTSSMKRMHGVVLSTAKISLDQHFS